MEERNRRRAARLVLPLLLFGAAASVDAANIYKYRLADGSTLYTQQRMRSAELLDVLHVAPPTKQQLAARRAAERRLQRELALADRLGAQRDTQSARAGIEVNIGSQTLAQAALPVPYTLTPLPGERQATVGGYSRLNDAYWERMQALGLLQAPVPAQSSSTQMMFAP